MFSGSSVGLGEEKKKGKENHPIDPLFFTRSRKKKILPRACIANRGDFSFVIIGDNCHRPLAPYSKALFYYRSSIRKYATRVSRIFYQLFETIGFKNGLSHPTKQ